MLAFLGVVALLHLLDRRDPRRHFVSEYAFTHPVVLGVGFLALAAAGLALAHAALPLGRWRGPAAAALFAVFALAVVALAAFPTDHVGIGPATTDVGRAHDAASGVAFLALFLALSLAFSAVARRGLFAVALLFGAVATALVVPAALAPALVGVQQRVFVGGLLVALVLLLRALRRGPRVRSPRRRAGP